MSAQIDGGDEASLANAWITQTAQSKIERLTAELHEREALSTRLVNPGQSPRGDHTRPAEH